MPDPIPLNENSLITFVKNQLEVWVADSAGDVGLCGPVKSVVEGKLTSSPGFHQPINQRDPTKAGAHRLTRFPLLGGRHVNLEQWSALLIAP